MTPQKRRYLLAIMLLAVSILTVAPSLSRADQQSQNGTIAINASGQGTPIDKKSTCGPATLSLSGSVNSEDNSQFKIKDITGNLQLGSNTFSISNGQGEANKKGTIQINAKSNGHGDHGYELVLHGNLQGTSVNFDSKESKFSSLCFLSLSGQANINVNSEQSSSNTSEGDGEDHSSTSAALQTVTQTVTATQTVSNATTKTEFSNHTITESLSPPLNVTTTVTQLNNQTITITTTQTVANSTITQTSTTTVANVTITQNATITVANTTITITTNSTTSVP